MTFVLTAFFLGGGLVGVALATLCPLEDIPYFGRFLRTRGHRELAGENEILHDKIRDLEKSVREIRSKESQADTRERQISRRRTLQRIRYLKKLAFSDGEYDPREKDLVVDYILNACDLADGEIVAEMRRLGKNPLTVWERVKDTALPKRAEDMFGSKPEAEQFFSTMAELASADGETSAAERATIEKLKASYNIV